MPRAVLELSAAISLYKVVAQTVQQDNEAQDCRLYSALVQGLAQDSSFYAESYSFLLDQIGVENAVVFSEDGEYAWNVLTLDGQSYHWRRADRSGARRRTGAELLWTERCADCRKERLEHLEKRE